MGSECSSSALHSSVYGDMVHDALFYIQSLCLSIRMQVSEESQDVLDRFLRPSTLGKLEDLGLSSSTNVSSVALKGNALSVFKHILHVLDGLLELQSLDSVSSLESVLEVSSQVIHSSFSS